MAQYGNVVVPEIPYQPGYRNDVYYTSYLIQDGVAGTPQTVSNHAHYQPIFIIAPVPITYLAAIITQAAPGSTMRLGLYNMLNGVPHAKLYETATMDTSVTGIVTEQLSTPYVAQPGFYFTALSSDWTGFSVRVRGSQKVLANANHFGCYSFGQAGTLYFQESLGAGIIALPNTATPLPVLGGTATDIEAIFYKLN